MKIFKKLILPISIICMLLLQTNNISYANNIIHNESKLGTHHLANKRISGQGYENITINVTCPDKVDKHNKVKVHFYNRTSEPVTVLVNGKNMTVNGFSGNSFELDVVEGLLIVTIRGLNDNSNQILSGELSVKSWVQSN